MEWQDRDKIDELLELTRENNKILRSMHRRFVWGQIMTVLYWMIILGVAGWAYVYLQPYLQQYLNVYQNVLSVLTGLEEKSQALPDLGKILQGKR